MKEVAERRSHNPREARPPHLRPLSRDQRERSRRERRGKGAPPARRERLVTTAQLLTICFRLFRPPDRIRDEGLAEWWPSAVSCCSVCLPIGKCSRTTVFIGSVSKQRVQLGMWR